MDTLLKAASPDNDAQVKRIVELFKRAYGEDFPIRQVYQPSFWKSRVGTRFTSFVAERNGEVIVHLAACRDRANPGHVQLCMPAVDPRDEKLSMDAARSLWELVERQAARQGWTMMYKFLLGNMSHLHQLLSTVFGFSEVAVYPGYCPPLSCVKKGERAKRKTAPQITPPVLIMQKSFRRPQETASVFVPAHHAHVCKALFDSLGLARTIRDIGPLDVTYTSNGREAVQLQSLRHRGVCHAFVQPSLLTSFNEAFSALPDKRFGDFVFFVNMADPKAPDFCTVLERKKFSFCGVLPLINGQDSLVYASRRAGLLKDDTFTAPRARALANYIEHGIDPTARFEAPSPVAALGAM